MSKSVSQFASENSHTFHLAKMLRNGAAFEAAARRRHPVLASSAQDPPTARQINHPHCMKLIAIFDEQDKAYLVLELIQALARTDTRICVLICMRPCACLRACWLSSTMGWVWYQGSRCRTKLRALAFRLGFKFGISAAAWHSPSGPRPARLPGPCRPFSGPAVVPLSSSASGSRPDAATCKIRPVVHQPAPNSGAS